MASGKGRPRRHGKADRPDGQIQAWISVPRPRSTSSVPCVAARLLVTRRMDADPERLDVARRNIRRRQEVEDRIGPPADVCRTVGRDRLGLDISDGHRRNIRRGKQGPVLRTKLTHAKMHASERLFARQHQHLKALLLIACERNRHVADRLYLRRGAARQDLLHGRGGSHDHVATLASCRRAARPRVCGTPSPNTERQAHPPQRSRIAVLLIANHVIDIVVVPFSSRQLVFQPGRPVKMRDAWIDTMAPVAAANPVSSLPPVALSSHGEIVRKKMIEPFAGSFPIGQDEPLFQWEPLRMRINFFDWIREGVRQSILLGLSDAAVEIGSEKDVEALTSNSLPRSTRAESSTRPRRQIEDAAKPWGGR